MVDKRIINQALDMFKTIAPYKTGNLSRNIQAEEQEDGSFILYVDDNIVPYIDYTTDAWTTASGRQNPNEGWHEEAAELFAIILQQQLGLYRAAVYENGE